MMINRLTLIATVAVAAVATIGIPSTASAKSVWFVGTADDDDATTIHFKAKGKQKKKKNGKKKFVAKEVSSIRVYDQSFVCYTANGAPAGHSGRHTYSGYALIDPLEVDGGEFGGFYRHVYQSPYGGDPLTLEYDRFRGKIRNKKATGAYQTQASEGGIEFGYCGDKNPVDWTAEAQKNAPDPPLDPTRAGVSGRYSGKIKHGGPVERKIVFRVTKKRAKLAELPLDLDCSAQTGEHISEVLTGGSGKLKKQFKQLGGETNFKIKQRIDDFHGGTLKLEIAAGFRGKKIAGTFLVDLDYGSLGNCSDGGDFRAK